MSGQHFVAAIHAAEVLRDEVLEQDVVVDALVRGQADETRQCARDGDDAEHLRTRAPALSREQQRQAESLVEDARKGMCRIDGDGC